MIGTPSFVHDSVGLHAVRVQPEDERAPLVVEGVETEGDPVVSLPPSLTGEHVGADQLPRVFGDDGEVDVPRVVADVRFSLARPRHSLTGLELYEVLELRRGRPLSLVDAAIERGRPLDARKADPEFLGSLPDRAVGCNDQREQRGEEVHAGSASEVRWGRNVRTWRWPRRAFDVSKVW